MEYFKQVKTVLANNFDYFFFFLYNDLTSTSARFGNQVTD